MRRCRTARSGKVKASRHGVGYRTLVYYPAAGGPMFNTMFPELHVSDCEAAAQFFEKALGYERGFTLIEDGHLDFAVMKHPDAGLELTLHHMMPASEATKPRYM